MCIIESVSTEKLFEEILKASKENTTLGELQNSKEYSLRIIEIGCKAKFSSGTPVIFIRRVIDAGIKSDFCIIWK